MISGAALAPFFDGAPAGRQLCVQANPIAPSVDLLMRLDTVASGSADNIPGVVDVLGPEIDGLPLELLLRAVCRILESSSSRRSRRRRRTCAA
jgi:hypothetical protein